MGECEVSIKLSIKNVGMIDKADVEIGGLTVIAGKNNTGKSTIGKILFSIITAIKSHRSILGENLNDKLAKHLEYIYNSIINITRDKNKSFVLYKEFNKFHPRIFYEDIEVNGFEMAFKQRIESLKIMQKVNMLNEIEFKNLEHLLSGLPAVLSNEDKVEDIFKKAIQKVWYSEFFSDIESKNLDFKKYPLEISILFDNVAKISIYKNNGIEIKISKNIENIKDLAILTPLKDATIIESPLVLNLSSSIFASDATFERKEAVRASILNIRGIVQLHIIDLMRKIQDSIYGDMLDNFDIYQIIGGYLRYDKESNDFIYTANENKRLKVINTASGIRAFGILQMLLNSQILNKHYLLILDEPEVHLHPEWQAKYAEILIKIIKEYNIPILVTTHSPYMLEALNKYSKKHNAYAKFYLADKGIVQQLGKSNDKTLEEAFKKLNEPFKIFDEMENE